jgi:hypothetical protein
MSQILHPEVLWAQRSSDTDEGKNVVYLSVNAIDLQHPKVELTASGVTVEGVQKQTDAVYKASLEFYEDIDVKTSKYHTTDRGVIFILCKATLTSEYWPRLTKSTKKEHFIRTDFDKWVDEDEQDGDASDPMSSYNLGAGGMPDMGDLDFSKLGGGAGMGGMDMGAAGMGDDDDESDDDMPELEADDAQDVGKGKEPATS